MQEEEDYDGNDASTGTCCNKLGADASAPASCARSYETTNWNGGLLPHYYHHPIITYHTRTYELSNHSLDFTWESTSYLDEDDRLRHGMGMATTKARSMREEEDYQELDASTGTRCNKLGADASAPASCARSDETANRNGGLLPHYYHQPITTDHTRTCELSNHSLDITREGTTYLDDEDGLRHGMGRTRTETRSMLEEEDYQRLP